MTWGIGIAGLSGCELDPVRLQRATRYFEARGHTVVARPTPNERFQRFAGSDMSRVQALHTLVEDPDIDLILGLRGGYGLTRILGEVDFPAIARVVATGSKRLVGHSDWTALSLALLAKAGAITFSGPMAGPDFGLEVVDGFTESQFWSVMNASAHCLSWDGEAPDLHEEGILWGGNLAMVCSLLGTPYFPDIDHGILFVEDVNEHPYRVERMLLQLLQAGVLQRQRAILIGEFSGFTLSEYDAGFDLKSVFEVLQERLDCPILTGLPFGHGRSKATLAVGSRASVRAGHGRISLQFSGYPHR